MAVWLLHRTRYARAYAVVIGILYTIVFTVGSIQLGNLSGVTAPGEQVPYVVADVVHVLLMLTGWLVAGLANMQLGDSRTREARSRWRWAFRSRTRLPSA